MKIYKKNEQSLMLKSFGFGGKLFLSSAVLVFFDLNDPEKLLTEQELWGTVPDQLGPGQALDMGFPKPRGEFLVTGSCFAPRGEERPIVQVSVRVGDYRKKLYVFGHRYWKEPGPTVYGLTLPEPFAEMPLTYQNAFGGEGFLKNPVGKGMKPATTPTGEMAHPLPNIEYPDILMGSPWDRPDPAGFGPLDVMWPPRSKKTGKYDRKWLRERWPFFPDNLNFEFFNIAPEDQFLNEYYTGDETIEIINMHPDLRVITSKMPPFRQRCFITKKKDLSSRDAEEMFVEVKTHIDTLWLFPTLSRAVVIHRGTMEILDDEYADVLRVFLASEHRDDQPKSIEHYYREQQKALDLTVPMDLSPLEKMQPTINRAMKRIKNIPKEIKEARLKVMGKRPAMPAPTPEETSRLAKSVIDQNLAVLDKLEAQVKTMQAQHGHRVKIDPGVFKAMRQKVLDTGKKLDQAGAGLAEAKQAGAEATQKIKEQLQQKNVPKQLDQAGIDPDNLLGPPPVDPWHDHGFPFVVQCRKNLEQDPQTMKMLEKAGLEKRTIRRAWLGLNKEERKEDPVLWGLEPGADENISLVLPPGLVIPRFNEATLTRILIRPPELVSPGRDQLVSGSVETPSAILTDQENAPVLLVTDELEALLVDQEVGDACSVVVLKHPSEKPDDQTAKALESALTVLIALPADPESIEKSWPPWEKAWPRARPLPLPFRQSILEARKEGLDVRKWVLDALPPDYARSQRTEIALPKPGQPPDKSILEGLKFDFPDIKGLINEAIAEANAFYQPQKDALLAKQEEVLGQVKDVLIKAGRDPERVLAEVNDSPTISEVGQKLTRTLEQRRNRLRELGCLDPKTESKLNDASREIDQFVQDKTRQYQDGMAEIDAGMKKLAAARENPQLPAEAREKLKAAGLDPGKMKKLTRDEVIEKYSRGESLAGANLTELDLSGLDLTGIDLNKALLTKANFTESTLKNANLSQAIAQEADFSKADLTWADLSKGVFIKAKFKKCILRRATLQQTILKKADLTEADLSQARLRMTLLERAILVKANLIKLDADMCVFSKADATAADFSRSRLFKCLFNGTIIEGVRFDGGALDSTMIMKARAEKLSLVSTDLSRFRLTDSSFHRLDFTDAVMHHACFRDSDLAGAVFQGANLDEAMFENCNLTGADLSRVSAKKCRFSKSNLEKANLMAVNLFMGSLRKARLVKTDLRWANLYGVDFYKAVVGQTRFDDANLKRTQLYQRSDLIS